jgi:dCTP deaminase
MDPASGFSSMAIKYSEAPDLPMILSGEEIVRRLRTLEPGERLTIRPFARESLQVASYDLRAGEETLIPHGECRLVPSMEWVEVPVGLCGTLRCRSSLGRKGIVLGGGFIDPGFRGQLTLCLANLSGADIEVLKNDRVVQMVLHEVRGGGRLYGGRYQDSNGAVGAR